jgi:drug/metabolite transporter (DMT)-like permease
MSSPHTPPPEQRLLGISLALCTYVFFTGIDASGKWLQLAGLPLLQVVFLRYAGHLIIAAAVSIPHSRGAVLRTRSWKLELARAFCLGASTVFNLGALQFVPLTTTAAILFTQPLIITALSMLVLREQVGWRRWTAIGVGFIGVLIIIQPGADTFHPAVLLSMVGAVFGSAYFLITRRLAGVDSVATQQLYSGLLSTLVFLPFALVHWVWPADAAGWVAFVLVGTCGFLGHQLATMAHTYAPASVLAPFGYTHMIWMALASWLIFAQPPDLWLFIGLPFVIGSGLYIWLRERQLHKTISVPTAD